MNNALTHRDGMVLLVALVLMLTSHITCFAASSFTGFGCLPTQSNSFVEAVSANGLVVVGTCHIPGKEAFRWTADGGMVSLGYLPGSRSSEAKAVSSDGSVIVGESNKGDCAQAYRWTAAGGMVRLGSLPGEGRASVANGVSSDGKIVVGWSAMQAFRWTAESGMVGLGKLPGTERSLASSLSNDGSVVVGISGVCFGQGKGEQAFRWTAAGGMIGFGPFTVGLQCIGKAVSGDGSVIAGFTTTGLGPQAYRWTAAGGIVRLGSFSTAEAISKDGSLVLGSMIRPQLLPTPGVQERAFVWDEIKGMRNLQSVLTDEYRLDLTGWSLTAAKGVSADGKVIVGNGERNGHHEAWIAHLDRPLNAPFVKK